MKGNAFALSFLLFCQGCLFESKEKKTPPPLATEKTPHVAALPFHCAANVPLTDFSSIQRTFANIEKKEDRFKLQWNTPIKKIAFISDARDFIKEDVQTTLKWLTKKKIGLLISLGGLTSTSEDLNRFYALLSEEEHPWVLSLIHI